jgi:hypothetical protein
VFTIIKTPVLETVRRYISELKALFYSPCAADEIKANNKYAGNTITEPKVK